MSAEKGGGSGERRGGRRGEGERRGAERGEGIEEKVGGGGEKRSWIKGRERGSTCTHNA